MWESNLFASHLRCCKFIFVLCFVWLSFYRTKSPSSFECAFDFYRVPYFFQILTYTEGTIIRSYIHIYLKKHSWKCENANSQSFWPHYMYRCSGAACTLIRGGNYRWLRLTKFQGINFTLQIFCCKHLNLKGKTLPAVVNKLFVFISVLKQNMIFSVAY